MSMRTTRKTIVFSNPFSLKCVDRVLPAGGYEIITDEVLIEELSFPVYRRVATMMLVQSSGASSVEMLTIDPLELAAAVERDTLAVKTGHIPERRRNRTIRAADSSAGRHRVTST